MVALVNRREEVLFDIIVFEVILFLRGRGKIAKRGDDGTVMATVACPIAGQGSGQTSACTRPSPGRRARGSPPGDRGRAHQAGRIGNNPNRWRAG